MILEKFLNFIKVPLAQCRDHKHRICSLGRVVCLICAAVSYGVGALVTAYDISNINFTLLMFPFLFLFCLFYCFENFRDRFLLLIFFGVMFVFVMGRPILNLTMGRMWYNHLELEGMRFALHSVALSLLCLCAGAYLAEKWIGKGLGSTEILSVAPQKQDPADFQLAALLLYLFTMAFFLLGELDKLLFMRGKEYEDFFLSYSSSLPFFVATFAAMMPFALCVYLSTQPKKQMAFCALALYVLSAAPQFLIGIRNPIVLNALLALLYYYYRDRYGDTVKWYGKLEKGAMVLAVPGGACLLAVMDFVRGGDKVLLDSISGAITDLFYKQGVSFNVLCRGYMVLDRLPGVKRNYTFGPFIDYFKQSRIGQMLMFSIPYTDENSARRAIYGHNLSHSISYLINEDYLEGAGSGSSYILELYCDFGWLGIAVGSLVLGALLIWFVYGFRKNWFLRAVILICLTDLFFAPRAEATGWLVFLVQPHFWCIILGCIIGGRILTAIGLRNWLLKVSDRIKKK